MENYIIAYYLEKNNYTPFVIRGPIEDENSYIQGITVNNESFNNTLSYTEMQGIYDSIVAEYKLDELRVLRNRKLSESDWTQFPDIPEETKTAWHPYRQALRDITETYSSPDTVVWPTKPE